MNRFNAQDSTDSSLIEGAHWQARSERGSTSAAALTSPATTSPASEAYRSFASSVAVPVPSLLRKRFHRSSSLHILCSKNALRRGCVFALEGRSRCAPDCQTDLAWTLRCVWSQLKEQKSILLCACDQMLCEGSGIIFGGNNNCGLTWTFQTGNSCTYSILFLKQFSFSSKRSGVDIKQGHTDPFLSHLLVSSTEKTGKKGFKTVF